MGGQKTRGVGHAGGSGDAFPRERARSSQASVRQLLTTHAPREPMPSPSHPCPSPTGTCVKTHLHPSVPHRKAARARVRACVWKGGGDRVARMRAMRVDVQRRTIMPRASRCTCVAAACLLTILSRVVPSQSLVSCCAQSVFCLMLCPVSLLSRGVPSQSLVSYCTQSVSCPVSL